MITLKKPNISPNVFELILRYIYTGSIPLDEKNVRINYSLLLVAADELALIDLIDYIQAHIITNEQELLRVNLIEFLQVSSRHAACHLLQTHCEDIISQNPSEFLKLDAFTILDKHVLINLLKKDIFNMEEIEIWENVIKWGISQNSHLSYDVSLWSPQDFDALRKSVQDCIPYIRFFDITGPDYYNKVRPFKKILPKELKADLQQWYVGQETPCRARMIPPRIRPFVSTIIGPGHIGQLAAWIDNKQEPYHSKNPYEFKLLMLGSRDGLYNVREFQRRCGKKGPTIIVIKIKNSNRIIGGYNPIEWDSSEGYLSSRESFIFSFDNNKNMTNCILSRVKNPDCAIFNSDTNYIGFGSDLEWFGGICEQYNYQRKILNQVDFAMENYEVFQVKKRQNY
ncbi:serine-enriched protein [Gigaspora margarita]|uniref:Serine-enriched protein n=1 Tax=Gigaspora margarita TaxID=4874 RepID=A0A8H3X438_GIGMA|nr:serine-enriched protein [Gigaspora margarita]